MSSDLPPIAIVVARYNAGITDRLLAGAFDAYRHFGGLDADLTIVEAAGAFEILALAAAATRYREVEPQFAGVLALGCIIKGETKHDEFLGHAVTDGLARLSMAEEAKPIGLGVLTVENLQQAQDRAGGKHGNKGSEAMIALLQTIAAKHWMMTGTLEFPGLARVPGPGGTAPDKTRSVPTPPAEGKA